MFLKLFLNWLTLFVFFFNLIDTFLLKNLLQQNADLQPVRNVTVESEEPDGLNYQHYEVDNESTANDDLLIRNDRIVSNISTVIAQLTRELALKVNDQQLVDTLQADRGKFKNLHKLKSDSSAYKWIQRNRFLMRRLNFLVANLTEEFVVHEILGNNLTKIDSRSADQLIGRVSQHVAANQAKLVDKRMQKSIEVGSGFVEGLTALTLGASNKCGIFNDNLSFSNYFHVCTIQNRQNTWI